jgi:hypothetical protein
MAVDSLVPAACSRPSLEQQAFSPTYGGLPARERFELFGVFGRPRQNLLGVQRVRPSVP